MAVFTLCLREALNTLTGCLPVSRIHHMKNMKRHDKQTKKGKTRKTQCPRRQSQNSYCNYKIRTATRVTMLPSIHHGARKLRRLCPAPHSCLTTLCPTHCSHAHTVFAESVSYRNAPATIHSVQTLHKTPSTEALQARLPPRGTWGPGCLTATTSPIAAHHPFFRKVHSSSAQSGPTHACTCSHK